jgi:hypothetical protein
MRLWDKYRHPIGQGAQQMRPKRLQMPPTISISHSAVVLVQPFAKITDRRVIQEEATTNLHI